jgi:SAM-dependent methyltransferase
MSPPPDDLYAPFARDYDAIYESLRGPSGDAAFYLGLARASGGPVLELGCGSGRTLLPIAREGIEAVGLDSSEAMLSELAAKSPPPNLRIVRSRLQDFDLSPQRFRLIFAGFRVFQHLLTVEDQLAALVRVRAHLSHDGLFAFDVFAPRHDRLAQTEVAEIEDARVLRDGEEIVRYAAIPRIDVARQIMDLRFRIERRRNAELLEESRWESSLRYFFRYELEHLLARSGFEAVEFYGGFDGRPFDHVSGETVVLARRAG